jgi:hypothetical protein
MQLFFSRSKACGPGTVEQDKECQKYGCGGDDSLVYDAVPDEPYIGGVNLRLFTGGARIRDKLSSLVVLDPDLDPAPDCDLSSEKGATKK